MNAIEVSGVTHRYGRITALRDLNLTIPEGAVYALLGPNGAGKTTLLQILMGLHRPSSGRVSVLGSDPLAMSVAERARIGYVAEGQQLPRGMTLRRLEAYLAPLYPTWDPRLAADLRRRFRLDQGRKIGALSRGEHMKAALLFALAPRPSLLLMDEPFTGMDVAVKDELVRGLLDSARDEGWTVLISSHDVTELESLADWVGFLDDGEMRLSESMDELRTRFWRAEVSGLQSSHVHRLPPGDWLSVEQAGSRMSVLIRTKRGMSDSDVAQMLGFPDEARVEVRPASLREIFIGLAKDQGGASSEAPDTMIEEART